MARATADLLVERLIDWGVDTIFGIPGDGINGVIEALRTRQDRIRFVQVRHEEAAALAAVGYAKFTGRIGVCLATSGPGGIHLLNGLYDAELDGQPVLAITGHTFHDLIGTHFQQDVALDRLFMDVAVYNERLTGPAHVENAVGQAVRSALSRRGPAHLNLPKDIQGLKAPDEQRSKKNIAGHSGTVFARALPLPPDEELRRAAEVINAGTKVVILAGQGALHAGEELLQLAEIAAGPIVKALLGKAAVPDDSPYTTGGAGLLGTEPSQDALEGCDTLVIVGSSFPYEEFYPQPGRARAVQIDLNPARIGLRYPVEVGLAGDSRAVLHALLPLLQPKADRSFLEEAQAGMREWRDLLQERGTSTELPMKPQVVPYELDPLLRDDAIIIGDSGVLATWIARYINIRKEQMFSLSGTLATMANGLPYAVGAQMAHPERQVVALVGDGGFTMLMGEIATCVKYNLPVKVIIFNNGSLGMIKWEQMVMEGNPEFGCDLQPIDFAKAAEAMGATGFAVEQPGDVREVLERALATPGPVVVDALVDANEPPMPPKMTRDQALHFAQALAKGQPERLQIALTAAREIVRQVI